jgi:hypothetical protein
LEQALSSIQTQGRRWQGANVVLKDRGGGVQRDLVVGGVARGDAEVEVLDVKVQVGQDELVLDGSPDDAAGGWFEEEGAAVGATAGQRQRLGPRLGGGGELWSARGGASPRHLVAVQVHDGVGHLDAAPRRELAHAPCKRGQARVRDSRG